MSSGTLLIMRRTCLVLLTGLVATNPVLPAKVLAQSPMPELPRVYVDTAYIPPTGQAIAVPAGGDFQAALNLAQPGDVIILAAGATFAGNFTLPNKTGTGWIIIRTSAPDASLPAPGTRLTPASADVLPKVVSPNSMPALTAVDGAHHYRFIGVEFTVTTNTYNLILLGNGQASLAQLPHDLIFDRVYIHGNPNVNLRRGITLNSGATAIIDSYISEVHEVGVDSQAIAGWNGSGPFKIVNNYLEGAGENILFGGADPSIPDLVPSDIEIRHNHVFKPLSWRISDPSYAGMPWSVKNLLELKNAQRVLIDGNLFEGNWAHAQNGFAILFVVRNQDGTAPWSVVQDVTFTHNIVRHTASAVNILGHDDIHPSQQTRRILIKNNLFEDVNGPAWGGSGRLFQLLDGTVDVHIDHNTAFQTGEILAAGGRAHTGFIYQNNIAPPNLYGVGDDNTYGNPLLTLSTYFPGAVFVKNVIVGGNPSIYPPDNFFPASFVDIGFVDLSGSIHQLSPLSLYKNAGTDGKDIGADMEALDLATAGAVEGSTGSSSDITPPTVSITIAGSSSIQPVYRVGDRMIVVVATDPGETTDRWYLAVALVTPTNTPTDPFFMYRFDPVVELITLQEARSRPVTEVAARPLRAVAAESLTILDLSLPAVPAGSYQWLAVLFSETLSRTSNVARASFSVE